jgi:hypothetical protein
MKRFNLQNNIRRGHLSFVSEQIKGGEIQGNCRSFTFFALMQIAVAKYLIDLGMTAKSAFHHVSEFALSGGDPFMGEPGRWAGLPYHHDHGETILAVSGARNCLGRWKDGEGDFFGETMSGLSESKSATDIEGAVFVNVSRVFRVVCERLGVDPHEVLDEAYADGFPDHGPEWPDAEG